MKKAKDMLNKRRTVPERLFFMLMFLFLTIWGLIVCYMMFWAIVSALKTNLEYLNAPLAFPEVPQFGNFKVAMDKLYYNNVGFFGMLFNSLWYAGLGAGMSTFWVCILGYVFAQYNFKGKEFLFNTLILTLIIPLFGNLPATYKLIYDLHLNDSYFYIIVMSIGGFNANLLITNGYYKGIPREYRESVYMDGGNDFVAYFKVYMPMGRSVFSALFLLNFIAKWNDYLTPILYLDKMPGLSTGLYIFQQEIQYVANNPAYFAGAIILMFPVVLLFICFQDKIMGQLHSGGLKG